MFIHAAVDITSISIVLMLSTLNLVCKIVLLALIPSPPICPVSPANLHVSAAPMTIFAFHVLSAIS